MPFKVLLPQDMDSSGKDLLIKNNIEIKMGTGIDEKILIREIEGCDGVITRTAIITENVIKASKKLKVIAKHGVGVDMIDVDFATKMGIKVVNASDSNKLSVAEYTIGLIIALAKNYFIYDSELRKGNFEIRNIKGMDLEGKTLGLIGFGKIGQLVAKKASLGLGMKILVYKRKVGNKKVIDGIEFTEELNHVLKNADFLSLHIPYTKDTKKLIGKNEISLMKKEAFLINTARGEVIDNDALADALECRKIAGAAIDVFENEIPTVDNKLFKLENVIVTPHAAAFSNEALQRMSYEAAMGVVEVLNEDKVTYLVNKI